MAETSRTRIVNIRNTLSDKVVSAPSVAIVSNTNCLVLIHHIMFCIDAFIVLFVLYFMAGSCKSRFSCLWVQLSCVLWQ